MDIAGLSVAMSQSRVQDEASIAVMKLAMNSGKEISNGMNEMLKMAVDPNLGRNLDIKA